MIWGAVALTGAQVTVEVLVSDRAVSRYPSANFCASSEGVAAVIGS